MPLYDYRCEQGCGEFRAFRPMAESSRPAPCPQCDAPAARTLAAPMLAGASPGWLGAPPAAGGGGWRRACGFGCSHAGCR
ncbi:MAG: zinc ribbon domain-containing protein [Rubrivivax sp.]